MSNEEQQIKKTIQILNEVSPSFCLAKWYQLTLYLQNGFNHSCHHPTPHKISIEELKANYKALHNTQFKKQQMQMMLDGERPPECDYCWRAEDSGNISDRVYKSAGSWARTKVDEVLETRTGDVNPSYLEISFSNVCNFKCAYCSPDLSSPWNDEIEKYGPYPTSMNYNNLDWFKQTGKMPIHHREHNPYVDAFWEWWPELYASLHTLRLTGGEPLLSKDVWRMLDYIEHNPKKDLVLAINTNLGIQDEFVDRIIEKINIIAPKVKEFQFFTSGEAVGPAGEYIRYGLDYYQWKTNLEKVLDHTNVIVAVMTTVNLTSVTSYADFVRYLLDLRGMHNRKAMFNKVQFMTNFLRWPDFLSLQLLDDATKQKFANDIERLIQERGNWDGMATLSFSEVDQLRRLVNFMNSPMPEDKLVTHRKDFVAFVDEYDKRRGTNFHETFPELGHFYKLCKDL